MSRTDIANYLVINCDTLSRTMMRFSDCGLIERLSRHAIRVIDLDALKKKSPLASLLSAVSEKESYRQDRSFSGHVDRNALMRSGHDLRIISPVVTTSPLSWPAEELR
jgi:hypothetical protein